MTRSRRGIGIALSSLLSVSLALGSVNPAFAAVANWQKSASILPTWSDDFGSDSFKQSLRDLKDTNANMVTLVIPYYQSNVHSTDINPGWNTPSDTSLTAGIRYAKSIGLQVTLKSHIETYDGQWRLFINPSDRNGWFTAYGNMLKKYAAIAQKEGVEQYVIGTELHYMTSPGVDPTNTQQWKTIIAQLRGIYSGKLTYSAQHGSPDEKNDIQFWSDLDSIGLSAYHPLTAGDSLEDLKRSWDQWNNEQIKPLHDRYGKPINFTEIGYRSVDGAHWEPAAWWRGGNANEGEQAKDYQALFEYWNNVPYMNGVHFWDWKSDPNAGGQGNTDYTPQNKQAEEVMRQWFGNTAGGSSSSASSVSSSSSSSASSAPSQGSSFRASASIAPDPPPAGQGATASVTVENTGNTDATNVITDIEIYNAQNQRVLQQYFEGQSIGARQSKTYPIAFTPPNQGTYVIKVGMFSSTWTQLYQWEDNARTFSTQGSQSSSSSSSSAISSSSSSSSSSAAPVNRTIDLWWPTNGSTLSGTQPFKALVADMDINNYTMFWQVDGRQLNEMGTSHQDWPHKESWVDLSGWNWNANGRYTLTFIARDRSGNEIARRSIEITVVIY